MNQRTSRGGGYGRDCGIIDLGHEPPLSVDGTEAAVIDRRRVSVQWFSGTILTGLCGAALIGGAVFASLDGETTFARVPQRVESALRGAFGDHSVVPHRSDRLPLPGEQAAARRIIRVSTVTRVGQHDVIRVRPLIRVSGNLSMTVSELSADIPPFNPQRLLSDAGSDTSPASANDPKNADVAAPDADVSFVTKDLDAVLPRAKIAAVVPLDAVLMRVRDAASWHGNGGIRYALANAVTDAHGVRSDFKLAYATEGPDIDPYAGFEPRAIPENVTLLPKTRDQVTGGNPMGEKVHIVKKGDTIASVLGGLGADADDINAIVAAFDALGRDAELKEGEKLHILLEPASLAGNARLKPYRVIIADDTTVEADVALSDLGRYVAVNVQNMNTGSETADNNGNDDVDGARLYRSVYETALRDKIPMSVVNQMIRIYSYNVDFRQRVQPGDSFDVFYAAEGEGLSGKKRYEVLYAALTVSGETKKYYRFRTPDDGIVDYYDARGRSAKKFLLRKPVASARVSSPFGMRLDPVVGVYRLHTGVDWAARYGSPIFAAGNGVIEKIGPDGGYGNYIRIKHNDGYETGYAHMSAFAKGMKVGTRVRQGEMIGFVGSTGWSTGAHCHFEILINGRFVNPLTVKLPHGRSLEGSILSRFDKERDRLNALMRGHSGAMAISDATGGPLQLSDRF
ncbi:MAG: M23 family metallopeptidase [Bradyrhizobium sp.]